MTLSRIPATDGSDAVGGSDTTFLAELLARARYVMFDFDGPLADLFSAHRAPDVARVLRDRIATWTVHPFGPPALTSPDDPHQILLDVAAVYQGAEWGYRVAELDKLLTEQEAIAASSARPTAHSDSLVRRMVDRGRTVAVTTNNAVDAVRGYLSGRQIESLFHGRIHGRAANPLLMKPNPACLAEALRSTGAKPGESLMVGDSRTDYEAAQALGIPFLGYAKDPRKRRILEDAGAPGIVQSLGVVLELVEAL